MKKARDIMTANPQVVTPEESIQRAAQIMRDADVGIVPVVDDQASMRLTGLVTDRDIAIRIVAEGRNSGDCCARDVMSTSPRSVGPDDDLDRVMDLMKSEKVRRVPVVEGDRLVGIIAQADVAMDQGSDSKTGDVVQKISEPGRR
ncbi:MAG TPA: CBS domain-containing protein [Longimicrobiales bacterium]|nr:CBS domain-containing protein [Longimicrobiales bacterium]